MQAWKIGDRVALKESALSLPYVICRRWYTDMYAGKKGRIIGWTAKGDKLAIEFDEPVFTDMYRRSKHDTGCHGKGKLHYCWYIPMECVEKDRYVNIVNNSTPVEYWL